MASPTSSSAVVLHPYASRLVVEILHQYGVALEQARVSAHHLRCHNQTLQSRLDRATYENQGLQNQLNEIAACDDVKAKIIAEQSELIQSLSSDLQRAWPSAPHLPSGGTAPAPTAPERPTSSASTIILPEGSANPFVNTAVVMQSVEEPGETIAPRKRKARGDSGRAAKKVEAKSAGSNNELQQ